MLLQKLIMASIAILVMSACTDQKEAKPAGVIPEAQLKAMEKARAVEDELKKQHDELRKKLNEE